MCYERLLYRMTSYLVGAGNFLLSQIFIRVIFIAFADLFNVLVKLFYPIIKVEYLPPLPRLQYIGKFISSCMYNFDKTVQNCRKLTVDTFYLAKYVWWLKQIISKPHSSVFFLFFFTIFTNVNFCVSNIPPFSLSIRFLYQDS